LGDAFMVDWRPFVVWAFPPLPLVELALVHAARCEARGAVLVPNSPGCRWWAEVFNGRDGHGAPAAAEHFRRVRRVTGAEVGAGHRECLRRPPSTYWLLLFDFRPLGSVAPDARRSF
jgi:hypothetical protein